MVGIDLKYQLKQHIDDLKDEEILDDKFDELFNLKDEYKDPHFVITTITSFVTQTNNLVNEMNKALNAQPFIFAVAYDYANRLTVFSASMGFRRMALASRTLRSATRNDIMERSLEALDNVTNEYMILKDRLEPIIQVEKALISHQTKEYGSSSTN